MAKTNPIGVRFRQEVLRGLQERYSDIDTPQKALVFLERFWVEWGDKVSKSSFLRKEPIKKEAEDTFMGHPIPVGLVGIQLAVGKNDIKVKAKKLK